MGFDLQDPLETEERVFKPVLLAAAVDEVAAQEGQDGERKGSQNEEVAGEGDLVDRRVHFAHQQGEGQVDEQVGQPHQQ